MFKGYFHAYLARDMHNSIKQNDIRVGEHPGGAGGIGGMFARRAPGALLLDYVPPEEPPSTPLGNALRIR